MVALLVTLMGTLGDLRGAGMAEPGGSARWAAIAEAAPLGQSTAELPVLRKKKKRRGDSTTSQPAIAAPAPSSHAVTAPASSPSPMPPETAPPGTSAACSPRPPVVLRAEPALLPEPGLGLPGRDALLVTLSTSGPGLGIRKIGFQALANAVVTIADGQPHAAPFSATFPPSQQPPALQFTLWRPDQAQGSWLRLVIVDGCGAWSTFTGRGPGA
ncbi:MAG: hypothetical protein U0893_27700 [Chloroflexota bacterium]